MQLATSRVQDEDPRDCPILKRVHLRRRSELPPGRELARTLCIFSAAERALQRRSRDAGGKLVFIDYGAAEFDMYTADIRHTFPVMVSLESSM